MAKRRIGLKWPLQGLFKRIAFQAYHPEGLYYTIDCNNVWPDDPFLSRERGGMRPGLGKAFALQMGSGNPVRSMCDLSFISGTTLTTRLMAMANGLLYRENPVGTIEAAGGSLTFNTAVNLTMFENLQNLYILDYADPIANKVTDGVITGTNTMTSATLGNFASAGANANDFSIVITEGGTGTGVTGGKARQTITIAGTPTGGTFTLSLDYDGTVYVTDPIPYNASAANVVTRLNDVLGTSAVTATGGSLPGTPVVVTFDSATYANIDIPLMTADSSALTGGTLVAVTIAETITGGGAALGTYKITAAGATATFSPVTTNATGVSFYVVRSPKKYDPVANTTSQWVATANKGTVPAGCKIGCLWRGRAMLAGDVGSPNMWYGSRQLDPFDWDFTLVNDPGAAIYGQATNKANTIGEPITAMIPHSDDCLIFGCQTSLWILRGDPGYGGEMDRLSPEIGIIGKDAWCYTPEGYLYFMSQDGLYMMPLGCGATPISVSRERLPQEFLAIASTVTVVMEYDVLHRMIYISLTPASAGSPTHWALDVKMLSNRDSGASASFWPMTVHSNYDPFSMVSRRNTISAYSTTYWGCRDGYIRRFQSDLAQDDSTAFTAYVWLGPLKVAGNDWDEGMLYEIVCTLAASSGDVSWAVKTGKDAQECNSASDMYTGTFDVAGLNYAEQPMVRGGAVMVKLSNGEANTRWALELLAATIGPVGKRRV